MNLTLEKKLTPIVYKPITNQIYSITNNLKNNYYKIATPTLVFLVNSNNAFASEGDKLDYPALTLLIGLSAALIGVGAGAIYCYKYKLRKGKDRIIGIKN